LFKPDIGEVPDVGGVRIVAVAEHGDIDQMCRCGILPDLAIDAGDVDPLVEPMADVVVAGIADEVSTATASPGTARPAPRAGTGADCR
jgi:hypothetical protein